MRIKRFLCFTAFFAAMCAGLYCVGSEVRNSVDTHQFKSELGERTEGLLLQSETDSEWSVEIYTGTMDQARLEELFGEVKEISTEKFFRSQTISVNGDEESLERERRYVLLFSFLERETENLRIYSGPDRIFMVVEKNGKTGILSASFTES